MARHIEKGGLVALTVREYAPRPVSDLEPPKVPATKANKRIAKSASQVTQALFRVAADDAIFALDDRNVSLSDQRPWFVYLFPLQDCSAFKIGFSCNPLRRISSFSGRYFERFDLYESTLLQLHSSADARAVEAALKSEFADNRAESPPWVPLAAGGHTEWFSAVHTARALERVCAFVPAYEGALTLNTADCIRDALARLLPSFEPWAFDQAQRICDDAHSVSLGYARTISPHTLRDWLDAYRYFELAIFADDRAALEYVTRSVLLTT